MRSPGKRAAPRHRARSRAARAPGEPADGPPAAEARAGLPPDGPRTGEPQAAALPTREPPARKSRARWAQAGFSAAPGTRRSGWRRLGPALRRLVVTPTFAAGLGVVVAAGLAANMSRTVLHFSSPFPGQQCPAGGCRPAHPHGGTPASVRPGVHISPGQPNPGPGAGARRPGAMGGVAQLPGSGGHQVTISYQLTKQWSGGFADQIIITGMAGPQYRTWTLAFGYPGARISSVQGARWQPGNADWGVARSSAGPDTAWPGEPGGPGGRDGVRLTVILSGRPVEPVGCVFDGRPCSFTAPGLP
jgi:Cellulose binding domain